MSLSFNSTQIMLIVTLFKKIREGEEDDAYLYKLAKEIRRSQPATIENLEKLEKIGIVHSRPTGIARGQRGPVRIYTLTRYGQNFAQVLLQGPFAQRLIR